MGESDRLVLKKVITVHCKNRTTHICRYTCSLLARDRDYERKVCGTCTNPFPLGLIESCKFRHRRYSSLCKGSVNLVVKLWALGRIKNWPTVYKWNLSHGSGPYSRTHSHHRRKFSPPPLNFPYSCYLDQNPLSKLIHVLYFNQTGFQVYGLSS